MCHFAEDLFQLPDRPGRQATHWIRYRAKGSLIGKQLDCFFVFFFSDIHTQTNMYNYIYIHMWTCVCIYIYIYVYIHSAFPANLPQTTASILSTWTTHILWSRDVRSPEDKRHDGVQKLLLPGWFSEVLISQFWVFPFTRVLGGSSHLVSGLQPWL